MPRTVHIHHCYHQSCRNHNRPSFFPQSSSFMPNVVLENVAILIFLSTDYYIHTSISTSYQLCEKKSRRGKKWPFANISSIWSILGIILWGQITQYLVIGAKYRTIKQGLQRSHSAKETAHPGGGTSSNFRYPGSACKKKLEPNRI